MATLAVAAIAADSGTSRASARKRVICDETTKSSNQNSNRKKLEYFHRFSPLRFATSAFYPPAGSVA
jgi:hypothetical protein